MIGNKKPRRFSAPGSLTSERSNFQTNLKEKYRHHQQPQAPALSRNPRAHHTRTLNLLTLADPLPNPPSAIIRQAASFAITNQPIQNRSHGSQRILMPRQDGRSLSLQFRAHLASPHRPSHFHQDSATRFREPRLPPVRLAVNQIQQLFPERLLAKKIRQSSNRLFHRPDAFHNLRPLLQELPKLFVRCFHHLMHRDLIGQHIYIVQSIMIILRNFHKTPPMRKKAKLALSLSTTYGNRLIKVPAR